MCQNNFELMSRYFVSGWKQSSEIHPLPRVMEIFKLLKGRSVLGNN